MKTVNMSLPIVPAVVQKQVVSSYETCLGIVIAVLLNSSVCNAQSVENVCTPIGHPSGSGIVCPFVETGLTLTGREIEHCIPNTRAKERLLDCEEFRQRKLQKFYSRAQESVVRARDYFKLNRAQSAVKTSDLETNSAARLFRDLIDHAFENETLAYLMYLRKLYEETGIEMPVARLGPPYNKIRIPTIEEFRALGDTYKRHCESPLDPEEWNRITAQDCVDDVQSDRDSRICRTARTLRNLQSMGARTVPLTIENITEIDECRILKARWKEVMEHYTRIAGELPIVREDVRGNDPIPTFISGPSARVITTDCRSDVNRDRQLLYNSSARCLICPAEQISRSSVSRKWVALLSTMVLACGDGAYRKEGDLAPGYDYVDMQTMQDYLHTFGHCSSDLYEWKSEPNIREVWRKIREWQLNSYWVSGVEIESPDAEDRFEKVYGLSYEQATLTFCDLSRFTRHRATGRISHLLPPRSVPLKKFMVDGRRRLQRGAKKVKDVALKNCMEQSLQRARALYSSSDQCLGFKWIDPKTDLLKLREAVLRREAVTVGDLGGCWLSRQIEMYDSREAIGFVDPTRVSRQFDAFRVYQDSSLKGGNLPDFVIELKPVPLAYGDPDFSELMMSYRDKSFCPVSAD